MTRSSCLRPWLAAALLVTGLGLPSAARAQDQVVSSQALKSKAQVQAYWTTTRMKNAKAMALPTLAGGPHPVTGASAAEVTGPLVVGNSGLPGEGPAELVGAAAAAALQQAAGPVPQAHAGTFAYSRYRLFPNTDSQYTRFPYSAVGQLFFTIPGQGDFVCSGSTVNARNRSLVWTAGHCVYSPGIGFHTNFLFVPARHEPTAPLGLFTAIQAFTTAQWANTGQFEFDHGALVMARGGKSGNSKIADVTGFLGFLANAERQQQFSDHGWPVGPRNRSQTPPGAQFDGLHHEICDAAFGAKDDPSQNGGALTSVIGCDQTGGTSGGPWIVDFSGVSGNTNLVNGSNSYRYGGPNPPENLKLYGPYFSDAAINLRNIAQAVPVP
jgi:hypothetical protein